MLIYLNIFYPCKSFLFRNLLCTLKKDPSFTLFFYESKHTNKVK